MIVDTVGHEPFPDLLGDRQALVGGASLRQDPGVVPGVVGSLLVIAVLGALFLVAGIDDSPTGTTLQPLGWVLIVVAYVALAMVQTYFLAGLVAGTDRRLRGQDSTLRGALEIANSRLHRLLPWAVVTATVTMVLQAIEERFGVIGAIVVRLVGLAWNLVTFLVVPILVLEDLGVGDALKRSKDLFKKTWGENVIGQFGLGAIGFLLSFPGIVLIVVGVIWLLTAAVVVSALSGIYARPSTTTPRTVRCRASSRASTSTPPSA